MTSIISTLIRNVPSCTRNTISGPCIKLKLDPSKYYPSAIVLASSEVKRFSTDSRCFVTEPDVFRRSKRGHFFQPTHELSNPFLQDTFLMSCLKRLMPQEVTEEVFPDLERFGDRIVLEIDALGRQAELEPPYHRPFNAWGDRVDELVTSSAWKKMHHISAEEGLIALAYERNHNQWSRLHQVAKLYMYSPSSGLFSCPLAMTDGAASLIESSNVPTVSKLKERAYPHLISRSPERFWTSGQWMTERRGGSDVGNGTDTVAFGPDSDGFYRLHGYKWFTSAMDAKMAFTLARLANKEGKVTRGTRGLSLFYLETQDENGIYNNLEIQKLKNKLGTRQLPTAELLLDGTRALLVGEEGHGISDISEMFTISRLHNSIAASGSMRRILQLSRDYATKRIAFKKTLVDLSLHMQTLARMEIETRGCTLITLEAMRLQGRIDCNLATSDEKLIHRILTPILKLYTAKQAVAVCSEGLESFGGQGYIEDTGLPTFLRDAQVLPIWEGTTNILSLDVLRVLHQTGIEALSAFLEAIQSKVSDSSKLEAIGLGYSAEVVKQYVRAIELFGQQAIQGDLDVLQNASRDLSFSLAQTFIGALLIEHACAVEPNAIDISVAKRWLSRPLPLLGMKEYNLNEQKVDSELVMDGYMFS